MGNTSSTTRSPSHQPYEQPLFISTKKQQIEPSVHTTQQRSKTSTPQDRSITSSPMMTSRMDPNIPKLHVDIKGCWKDEHHHHHESHIIVSTPNTTQSSHYSKPIVHTTQKASTTPVTPVTTTRPLYHLDPLPRVWPGLEVRRRSCPHVNKIGSPKQSEHHEIMISPKQSSHVVSPQAQESSPQHTPSSIHIPFHITLESTLSQPQDTILSIPAPPHIHAQPTPHHDIPTLQLPCIALVSKPMDTSVSQQHPNETILSILSDKPMIPKLSVPLLNLPTISPPPSRRKLISSQPPLSLQDILSSTTSFQLFHSYLIQHACDESLSFYQDVMNFMKKWDKTFIALQPSPEIENISKLANLPVRGKSDSPVLTNRDLPTPKSYMIDRHCRTLSSLYEMSGDYKYMMMQAEASRIYHHHIHHLNLSNDITSELNQYFHEDPNKIITRQRIHVNVFIPAINEIMEMLKSDAFQRFMMTSQYQQLVSMMSARSERKF